MAETLIGLLVGNWFVALPLFLLALFLFMGFRLIPNNKIGVVEKRWSGGAR